jgi:DNA-directed RNA polymerase
MRPHPMRQANGFPPNFVHSLDSSHMMLTSMHLWNRGITFASVHDCYWTHAANVEIMNVVCREQFVNLHKFPIVEMLAESFEAKLKESEVAKVISPLAMTKAKMLFSHKPKKGELDLDQVKKSVYFFS